ncbi:unnamed protein product [Thlaspi arvense]|uniref:Uncharacterized protein n=1 Tax=Thlaspi arvense TaxID=13288 RepID=A0AAU9RB34_THLAR|nr:unnamed protein product [Thlaspi arvense]
MSAQLNPPAQVSPNLAPPPSSSSIKSCNKTLVESHTPSSSAKLCPNSITPATAVSEKAGAPTRDSVTVRRSARESTPSRHLLDHIAADHQRRWLIFKLLLLRPFVLVLLYHRCFIVVRLEENCLLHDHTPCPKISISHYIHIGSLEQGTHLKVLLDKCMSFQNHGDLWKT